MAGHAKVAVFGWFLLAGCPYITPEQEASRMDLDGDGVSRPLDCDDGDAGIGSPRTFWLDEDDDGFGASETGVQACTPPFAHVPERGDCDDQNPDTHPNRHESCNGIDDDCDGRIDDGLLLDTFYGDTDGDGYGDTTEPVVACAPGPDASENADDCDDHDADAHPGAIWSIDADGDGAGGTDGAVESCLPPEAGWVGGADDCNDADPLVHPEAQELCGGADENCDGRIDESGAAGETTWYVDDDLDGFGDAGLPIVACARPHDAVATNLDCDDGDPEIHPLAFEICDGADNNCNTAIDDADPGITGRVPWFPDLDGDGFGSGSPTLACVGPAGHVPSAGDCNDGNPDRNPGAIEVCGGIDDDCDGLVDDADPSLNVYTCGTCPEADPVLVSATPIHLESWNPCLLDPETSALCSTDPLHPDTHTSGERLHRVFWREDQGFWRDDLLLFLPPGPGRENQLINSWAAYAGYRVISLGYPNDDGLLARCANDVADACYRNVLYETTYGDDLSEITEVSEADAIVTRLSVLLRHLAVEDPQMGFDRYLTPEGTPEWSRIIVTGWSGGGGQAAFLAKYEPVRSALLMSAPKDHGATAVAPVDWVSAPSVTPGCAMLATWHVDEPYSAPPEAILPRAWDAMGIPTTVFDLDLAPGESPPPGTARVSQSVDVSTLPNGCNAHAAVGRDFCMRNALLPAYLYLFCTLDELDRETCG